jgi:hypothetical protein
MVVSASIVSARRIGLSVEDGADVGMDNSFTFLPSIGDEHIKSSDSLKDRQKWASSLRSKKKVEV